MWFLNFVWHVFQVLMKTSSTYWMFFFHKFNSFLLIVPIEHAYLFKVFIKCIPLKNATFKWPFCHITKYVITFQLDNNFCVFQMCHNKKGGIVRRLCSKIWLKYQNLNFSFGIIIIFHPFIIQCPLIQEAIVDNNST